MGPWIGTNQVKTKMYVLTPHAHIGISRQAAASSYKVEGPGQRREAGEVTDSQERKAQIYFRELLHRVLYPIAHKNVFEQGFEKKRSTRLVQFEAARPCTRRKTVGWRYARAAKAVGPPTWRQRVTGNTHTHKRRRTVWQCLLA